MCVTVSMATAVVRCLEERSGEGGGEDGRVG